MLLLGYPNHARHKSIQFAYPFDRTKLVLCHSPFVIAASVSFGVWGGGFILKEARPPTVFVLTTLHRHSPLNPFSVSINSNWNCARLGAHACTGVCMKVWVCKKVGVRCLRSSSRATYVIPLPHH